MATADRGAKDELIQDVMALARTRVAAAERDQAVLFLHQFYRRVPAEDLIGRRSEDLYFAAFSMLNFMRERARHQDKLKVYNPTVDEDGWTTTHTVIDLVTGDRPFLVDSLTAEINRRAIPLAMAIHPTLLIRRDEAGALVALHPTKGAPDQADAEAVIRLEIGRLTDPDGLEALTRRLESLIDDVRRVVEDWRPMTTALHDAAAELEANAPAAGAIEESAAFLRWLSDDNFTFLGYRNYDLVESGEGGARWQVVDGTAAGVLRDAEHWAHTEEVAPDRSIPPDVLADLKRPDPLMITKTKRRATVHRAVHMDSVGIKRYGPKGRLIGAHRFLGLFTSAAHHQSPGIIPRLRQKVAITVARAGFSPGSHDGKALLNVLETYPRDELFQISDDDLLDVSLGILDLEERPRLRLFLRRDTFDRFVSCLAYVPRERYDSGLREKFGSILEDSFDGDCEAFYTHLGDEPLARLHVIVRITPGRVPAFDRAAVESRLAAAARGWEDGLGEALLGAHEEQRAAALFRRYGRAFPSGYRDRFTARQAVRDIERIEAAVSAGTPALNLYRLPETSDGSARFKIAAPAAPLALSDVLPMLENMGLRVLDEFPYPIKPTDGGTDAWIHDFGMVDSSGAAIEPSEVKQSFEEAFTRIRSGAIENDGFNRLVIRAGLAWRQVVILRAYCKFLRQAKIPFSQDYMERTLASNPSIAALLVALFEARFDPDRDPGDDRGAEIESDILTALDAVANLDEDRIIRRFLNAVRATLRTNYFQADAEGRSKDRLALKIDSQAVDDLPLPRPMVEIFVYSPRMEGVHLRGGSVARGGLRWSDRPEDFRTEVLGLMKAQMVKNAVIVPLGSKGGFVVKRPPVGGDRDALLAEGVACYETLIEGMLDITDNLVAGAVVAPERVVRHDGDDPYLVVAADKGTATFSDIANRISEAHGFWLADAFASGGSAGYDHKRMGITARGAWESVKRHFRELGLDTQSEPFTVVGIGDMSGDVFGNGMLLSEHIRLVGAFNHLHVFIDPDPDPAPTFAERKRLFELPRSGWGDYDTSLISPGGGVFDRSAKAISLTPEIRRLLDLDRESPTPNEVISAMLRAPVDLLWNGGIGTYAKAAGENHADIGDRANDGLRVDAKELRCRVIGEGGNLGFTQLARIEAAEAGIKVNSDAIDNSAGVDCSDHEVNIKILLGAVVAAGEMTRKQRDRLLGKMTEDVAEQCLRDNYLQAQGISVIAAAGADRLEVQGRMMQMLERDGRLDREIEFLPDQEVIAERAAAAQGLTRPEISVLFAYAKNALYDQLLASDLPEDRYLQDDLVRYFPTAVRKKYLKQIQGHRLRREIIATMVANSMVNRASMVFPLMAQEETGESAENVARAYVVTREVFGLRALWAEIESLDNRIPSSVQVDMILDSRRLMEHSCLWFLTNRPRPLDCAATITQFGAGVETLTGCLESVLPADQAAALESRSARLREAGVPEGLAGVIGGIAPLASACDIVDVAARATLPVADVARTYFQIGARLGLEWLRGCAGSVQTQTHWQRQAVASIIEDLYGQQRAVAARVVASEGAGSGAVDSWIGNNQAIISRNEALFTDLRSGDRLDLAMLAVANRQMRSLIAG